jgi:hypothetical protein
MSHSGVTLNFETNVTYHDAGETEVEQAIREGLFLDFKDRKTILHIFEDNDTWRQCLAQYGRIRGTNLAVLIDRASISAHRIAVFVLEQVNGRWKPWSCRIEITTDLLWQLVTHPDGLIEAIETDALNQMRVVRPA